MFFCINMKATVLWMCVSTVVVFEIHFVGEYSPFFGHNSGFFQSKDISQSSLDFSRPITLNKSVEDSHIYEKRTKDLQQQQLRRNDSGRSYYTELSTESGKQSVLGQYHRKAEDSQYRGIQSNSLWPGGPIEGSYYEWRMIVSDCSVSCGKGWLPL